jgi:adenylate cyclase
VLPDSKDPRGDAELLRLAIEQKLVLSQVFDYAPRDPPIRAGKPAAGIAPAPASNFSTRTTESSGYVANHAGLADAPCVGNIGFIPDADGKLRRVIHQTLYKGKLYPSLSLAVIKCLRLSIQSDLLTTESLTPLLFDIRPDRWIVIPAKDIFAATHSLADAEELRALIQNKIVIIGSSALGLADRVATPISANMSGMFVHAQAISELLEPRAYRSQRFSVFSTALVHLGLVLALGVSILRLRKPLMLWLGAGLILLIWLIFAVIQIRAGNPITQSAALWGFLVIGLTLIPALWLTERQRTRYISDVLARYVSIPVLKEILSQQDAIALKPKSAEITVLVADMASYSETVSQQSLDDAAAITRGFLSQITEPVWACRGTLDRYTGDGLIAFWGAPIDQPDHAQWALKAAELMRTRLEILNAENTARGLPKISLRIGIASGTAMVGDFGTQKRANYTAVGNCINMASRLESAARGLNRDIVISETTTQLLTQTQTPKIQLVPLGAIDIRGFGPTQVYSIN